MDQKTNTITLDGVTHEVSKFSEGVQQAIGIYNTFQAELQKEQLAVVKTQAALQSIAAQITAAVKKELEEAEKPAASEDGAAAA